MARTRQTGKDNGRANTETPTEVPLEPAGVDIQLTPIEAQFLYEALAQGSFPTPQTKQLAASVQFKLEAAVPQDSA